MKSFLLLILSLIDLSLSSQVISPAISWDGVLDYTFQNDFIAKKKIKRIDADLSSKNPSQKIRPSNEKKFYQFNPEGFQIEYYNEKKIASLELITHNISSYKSGKIQTHTQRDEVGYFRKYYTHLADTTFIKTFRSENYNPAETEQITDSTLINSVSLLFLDNQKKTINKNGVHIKSELIQNDALGLLAKTTLEYKLSQKKAEKRFTYNESGLTSEVLLIANGVEKKFKYFYDEHDVIRKIETWKNNLCIKRLEFIYNAKGWLDSTLLQNTENSHIKITKFTYTLLS